MKIFISLLTFLLLTLPVMGQQTFIHAGHLFDGITGELAQNKTVVVEDGRIVSVLDGFESPASGAELIDLSEMTVLPGLIDLHVHLEGETNPNRYVETYTMNPEERALRSVMFARRTLDAGFTTVRDLGGSGVNTALRDAIRAGYVDGPRVISVGKSLATTGGHADPTNGHKREFMGVPGPESGVINGVEDAREAVRQRYKNGADHIKITATGGVLSVAKSGMNPQFMDDELQAVVETARDYEMHVAAHAHGKEGMLRAVRAGVRTIEHGTYMDEEVMQAMVEAGTYYVPTISAGKFVAEKAEVEGYFPALVEPKAREIGPLIQSTFAQAYRYGVNIAFGTDAGVFPHGENGQEFGYMVEAGMPPVEAIMSSVKTAPEVLGLEDEIGSIEAGKHADIIAVRGNPLEDITILEDVRFVMKGGMVYKQE
ncbi:metal-dependent hydrolase family protein [Rhodohalobacter mucosus]|uniref:Amidohydrolase n=1 Tax=Rhodohalobacter mucosus TaxID=2079485 RepID=A0A316TUX4_9BACT|nr:amidohydrolase [Rhodohalobacter mucosus]